MFGGKLEGGRTVGKMDIILPVEGEIVMVAGETMRLSFSSKMTALEETRTVGCNGESWRGVAEGVGYGYVVVILTAFVIMENKV